jgi:hypothetical protein
MKKRVEPCCKNHSYQEHSYGCMESVIFSSQRQDSHSSSKNIITLISNTGALGSRDCVVGVVARLRDTCQRVRDSIPGRGRKSLFFYSRVQTGSGLNEPPIKWVTGNYFWDKVIAGIWQILCIYFRLTNNWNLNFIFLWLHGLHTENFLFAFSTGAFILEAGCTDIAMEYPRRRCYPVTY